MVEADRTAGIGGEFSQEGNGTAKEDTYRFRVLGATGVVVEVVESYEGEREKHFLHHDHLASVGLETDQIGNVLEQHRTTPFGERLKANGAPMEAGNTLSSGFGGHSHEQSGFIDMGGRHYDPSLGRFLTTDPINARPLDPQSYNGFAYVLNDPLSLNDPSGFSPCGPDLGCGGNGGAGEGSLFSFGGGGGAKESDSGDGSYRRRHFYVRTDPVAPVVDVQQARAPQAAAPAQGMVLPMVQPSMMGLLTLGNAPFDAPSPRAVAANHRTVPGDLDLQIVNVLDNIVHIDEFAAGFGDMITLGGTRWFRERTGVNGTVDEDSLDYGVGGIGGLVVSLPVQGAVIGRALKGLGSGLGWLRGAFSGLYADTRGLATIGSAGRAIITQHGATGAQMHMTILVEAGELAVHTHLQRVGRAAEVAFVTGAEGFAAVTETFEFLLPNASKAIEMQRYLEGLGRVFKFNNLTENCITHCGDILRTGELAGVPHTSREIVRWLTTR